MITSGNGCQPILSCNFQKWPFFFMVFDEGDVGGNSWEDVKKKYKEILRCTTSTINIWGLKMTLGNIQSGCAFFDNYNVQNHSTFSNYFVEHLRKVTARTINDASMRVKGIKAL